MNKTRLLNAAKACREAPNPEKFNMETTVNWECGTPGCVFGHYAARPDLQDFVRIVETSEGVFSLDRCFYETLTADHFGITPDDCFELFDSDGCGNAETPTQAAEYIERFVAERT